MMIIPDFSFEVEISYEIELLCCSTGHTFTIWGIEGLVGLDEDVARLEGH